MRLVDDLVADGAEEGPRYLVASVSTNHDHLSTLLLRHLTDDIFRFAFNDDEITLNLEKRKNKQL